MTCHWTWLGEVRSSGLVGEHLERRSGRTWPALSGCEIPALPGASYWKTAAQPLTTLQLHHRTPVNNKHGLIFLQSNNTYNLIANCSATLSNTCYQQPMTQSLIDKWTVNTYWQDYRNIVQHQSPTDTHSFSRRTIIDKYFHSQPSCPLKISIHPQGKPNLSCSLSKQSTISTCTMINKPTCHQQHCLAHFQSNQQWTYATINSSTINNKFLHYHRQLEPAHLTRSLQK